MNPERWAEITVVDPCVMNPGTSGLDHCCGPVCDDSRNVCSGVAAVDSRVTVAGSSGLDNSC